MRNDGAIPNLDDDAVVEVAVPDRRRGADPLPRRAARAGDAGAGEQVKAYERLTVAAAVERRPRHRAEGADGEPAGRRTTASRRRCWTRCWRRTATTCRGSSISPRNNRTFTIPSPVRFPLRRDGVPVWPPMLWAPRSWLRHMVVLALVASAAAIAAPSAGAQVTGGKPVFSDTTAGIHLWAPMHEPGGRFHSHATGCATPHQIAQSPFGGVRLKPDPLHSTARRHAPAPSRAP